MKRSGEEKFEMIVFLNVPDLTCVERHRRTHFVQRAFPVPGNVQDTIRVIISSTMQLMVGNRKDYEIYAAKVQQHNQFITPIEITHEKSELLQQDVSAIEANFISRRFLLFLVVSWILASSMIATRPTLRQIA